MKTIVIFLCLIFTYHIIFSQGKAPVINFEVGRVHYLAKNCNGHMAPLLHPSFKKHIGIGFAAQKESFEFEMAIGYSKYFKSNNVFSDQRLQENNNYLYKYKNKSEGGTQFKFKKLFKGRVVRPFAGMGMSIGLSKFEVDFSSYNYIEPDNDFSMIVLSPILLTGIQFPIEENSEHELVLNAYFRNSYFLEFLSYIETIPNLTTVEYGISVGYRLVKRKE